MLPVKDVRSFAGATENADTVIRTIVPFLRNLKTVIAVLGYTSGGTAHTVTILQAQSQTKLSADAASSQAVINLVADPGVGTIPGAIAANDKLVIEKPDGTLHFAVVQSVSSLAITLTANVPTGGLKAGARVWFYGTSTDKCHTVLKPATSATTFYAQDNGLAAARDKEQPMIVESTNATAAGTIAALTVHYVAVHSVA
jgi:hypothetical protein